VPMRIFEQLARSDPQRFQSQLARALVKEAAFGQRIWRARRRPLCGRSSSTRSWRGCRMSLTVESDGGLDRGCHWEAVWTIDSATISMEVTWPWGQGPSSSCSTTEPAAHPCTRQDQAGTVTWFIGEE
jgi:hypothetical protein